MKYRKKPVFIEAIQWVGDNFIEIDQFITSYHETYPQAGKVVIVTLEGDMVASMGDWIIQGVNGEFYPCKPNIFAKTYELADTTPEPEPDAMEVLQKVREEGQFNDGTGKKKPSNSFALHDSEAAALIESYGRRVPRAMLEEVYIEASRFDANGEYESIDEIAAKYGVKLEDAK